MRTSRTIKTLAGAACALFLVTACGSDDGGTKSVGDKVAEGCTPAHEFTTVKKGKLTVVPYEFLPYAGIDKETNELIGVDGEIVSNIAKVECLELEILQLPASSALEALNTDRADMTVGGWYRTEERGKEYGQTTPGYYDFVSMVSKKDDAFDSLDQVKGKKIAMVQGSLWVEQSQKLFGKNNIAVYQTPDAAINDISNGRVDVAFVGSGEGAQIASKKDDLVSKKMVADPRLPASQEVNGVNYPHKKSNTALTEALNEDIEKFRSDGTVEKILQKWGYTDPANLNPES